MNCRYALTEDYNAIVNLKIQVHKRHVLAEPNFFKDLENPLPSNFFDKLIVDKRIYVLEDENKILGYAFINFIDTRNNPIIRDQKILFIDDLCIDENHRNKGYGKFFLQELEKIGNINNCDSIELSVWNFNNEAKSFYKKNEMKETLIRMKKPLKR